MKRSTLIIGLLLMCGAAYVVSKTFTPAPVVKPVIRVPVITRTEPAAPRTVRERTPLAEAPVVKDVGKKDPVETRFAELKEEGRYIRDSLMKTEPLANQAYQNVGNDPQYRELYTRRRLLENSWDNASAAERQSIVAEVNSIREATLGMVLTELAKLKSAPAPTLNLNSSSGTLQSGRRAEPAPPPPPPIIYM